MVDGATKGDVLAVYIESIIPRGQNPRGTVCMIPNFGGLTGTDYTATLNESLPEKVKKVNVDETGAYWSDTLTIPYRPHIGAIGCSPEIDSITSLAADSYGRTIDTSGIIPSKINDITMPSAASWRFIREAIGL